MQLAWILPSLVLGAYLGFSTGSWYMLAMSGMSAVIAVIVRHRQAYRLDPEDQIIEVGRRHYLGDKRLPRAQIFWRKEWVEAAWHHLASQQSRGFNQQRLAEVTALGFIVDSGVWLGRHENTDVSIDLFADGPHLLVVGPTGSGKSELCRLLAVGWLNSQKHSVELAFIDFKGGATFEFLSHHERVVGMATDLEDHRMFSAGLAAELARRERLFHEAKCSNIDEYQRQASLARLVIIIDEATAYLRSSSQAADLVEALAGRGRSLGIHLVLATQTLSGLPRSVLANLGLRIAVGKVDPVDLMQLGLHSREPHTAAKPMPSWARAKLVGANSRIQVFNFPLGVSKNCGSISLDAL